MLTLLKFSSKLCYEFRVVCNENVWSYSWLGEFIPRKKIRG